MITAEEARENVKAAIEKGKNGMSYLLDDEELKGAFEMIDNAIELQSNEATYNTSVFIEHEYHPYWYDNFSKIVNFYRNIGYEVEFEHKWANVYDDNRDYYIMEIKW